MTIQDEEITKEFPNYFEKFLNKPHKTQGSEPEMVFTEEPFIENSSLEEVQSSRRELNKCRNDKSR